MKNHLIDSFDIEIVSLSDSVIESYDKGIIVTLDATHGGYINRNFYFYNPLSMQKAVDSWTKPYPKPVLKNHDKHSEPLGRVINARYIGNHEKGFIQLEALITDKDAIEKIKDGRYLTVSTSGQPKDYFRCSVCGTNILKEGWCGHSRGKYYTNDDGEKVLCYFEVGEMEYTEVSIVNKPADNDGQNAAIITSWKIADEEEEFEQNPEDNTVHTAVAISDTVIEDPADEEGKKKALFLLLEDVDIIANKTLWDSIDKENPEEKLEAYLEMGGHLTGLADADVWVPTEDDLQLLDWLSDALVKVKDSPMDPEYYYLTDYAEDENGIRHRHVVSINKAGNGHTDYAGAHSHEVAGNKILPNRIYDVETDKFKDGHTHNILLDTQEPADSLDLFDAPMKESTKKNLSKKSPKKFCGPMDPRKGRRSFPVTSCSQARTAMRLLPKYKGPGDKEKIKACIRRRAKSMGCPFSDSLEQAYELLSLIEEFA